jgi:hypothetical protein
MEGFNLWIPMKLIRIIKMCFSETYSQVHISKNLSDAFTIPWPEQADALLLLLFSFVLELPSGRLKKTRKD